MPSGLFLLAHPVDCSQMSPQARLRGPRLTGVDVTGVDCRNASPMSHHLLLLTYHCSSLVLGHDYLILAIMLPSR